MVLESLRDLVRWSYGSFATCAASYVCSLYMPALLVQFLRSSLRNLCSMPVLFVVS
jgi:hypothetical protein